MSILRIPTDTTALFWDATLPLEGIEYVFEFYWSDREERWYLNIRNQAGDLLAGAIAIVVAPATTPDSVTYKGLLQRYQCNGNVPPGRLFAIDMSGAEADITESTELGDRVVLLYVTSDDTLIAE